ncbi:DUF2961 domain-containing protein [Ferruginibacter paludis]|uniref:glycoside hydrolase family 172 protein n=1 Tax=Ferruginibacter paludis TaxID=1310417 RepID=UPI0025B46C5B|nr:glycoside hydrolase family 172 protein [Ferruginibacter paludis]MDN3655085.1 DUF2961 domain-containing protein [Ferruginibacter paludis]
MKKMCLPLLLFLCQTLLAQQLYQMPEGVRQSTISTFENINGIKNAGGKTNKTGKGNAFEDLKAGASKTLLNVQGAGIIQRMWFTVRDRSPEMLRSMRLRMYWDNSSKPAVDVPFGDFFGFGLSKMIKFESALFSSPEGRSFNCYIPMPYKTGAKVVITNESNNNIELLFFDIDFIHLVKPDPKALYFHAYWTRQKTSALGSDFEFLPAVKGKGRYLGVNMGVNADKRYADTWWGEGEVKIYKDGDDKLPGYNGTGSEDYIGTGWGLGTFTNMYQGATIANDSTKQYAFYRFHIPDQVFFNSSFRGTIQQIGGGDLELVRKLIKENVPLKPVTVQSEAGFNRLLDNPLDINDAAFPKGWVNFYRIDDYSATTYFYLDKPVTNLAALPEVSERIR